MKILAVDLSTDACSVALLYGDELLQRHEPGRRPSRQVLQSIERLLGEAEFTLADLDGIAFGHGPGAFTGLRIAAGVAQGLAFGIDRPVIGISSLQALAQVALDRHDDVQRVAVALDARMDEIYAGAYFRDSAGLADAAADDELLPPGAWQSPDPVPELYAGEGWAAYAELEEQLKGRRVDLAIRPEAGAVARLAAPLLAAGKGGPPESAIPVYLRDKVAWQGTP